MKRVKPTYLQIADSLREKIERRELEAGDRFPTERELVQEFDVARMTVRHALDVLQHEGLIDRRRGRTGGTFVRNVPPVLQLSSLNSVVAQLDHRGHEIQATVLDVKVVNIHRPIAGELELDEFAKVWIIRRIREVDGTPVMLSIHYIPHDLFPELGDLDLTQPLHDLLEEHYQSGPVFKREVVTPVLAGNDEQECLNVTPQHPLLRLARTAKNKDGQVIGFTEEYLRADIASVEVVVGHDPSEDEED